MTRGPAVRASAVVVAVLLALVGLVLVPAPGARADFASQCAAPDRTVGAADSSITVRAGETVLVAASFTGGVDALPAGGTLCVAAGATLDVLYMNNAAGALVVATGGAAVFGSVVVAAGFSLEAEGTVEFAGLGVNGAANVHVAPGGQLTVGSGFSPAAGTYRNEGAFVVEGGMNLNTAVAFHNVGTLSVQGAATVNGPLINDGLATFSLGLTVNGTGSLENSCVVDSFGPLRHNGSGSSNSGRVQVSGDFTNNGTWQQAPEGVTTAVGFTDDGAVTGFGGYRFSARSSVQGSFVGDSADEPIRVQSVAPPGQIFDVQTGTVANVVRAPVVLLSALPACAGPPSVPSADVEATKSGPATVLAGGTVAYTVVVQNNGEAAAADVVVSDPLPAGFTLDPASTTGTDVGGVLTWQLGTLAVGAVVTLPFSGVATAAVGATIDNVVSSTSSTPDPVPSNNDGSADASRASTLVVAEPPAPNLPPVAQDLERTTITGLLVLGRVRAADPDPGQRLRFTLGSGPANGQVYVGARGVFAYLPARDFAGIDSFEFEVCDNAVPTPACDTGVVTVNVYPRARLDVAQTFAAAPVVVPVLANDTAGAPLDPVVVTSPANGAVTLDPSTGTAAYTPAPGFLGTDTFVYRICSPTEPTFCDTATVRVEVLPENLPPVVDPLTLTTTSGTPVSGRVLATDPNPGDTVSVFGGVPPRSGTRVVAADGSTTYRPLRAFAGRDHYGVIACDDGTPQLCATGRVSVDVYPVAVLDAAMTPEGTSVDIDVLANDRGAVLAPTLTTPPANGTARFLSPTARYVPAAGFTGTDTFTYTICAVAGEDLCSTATVTVTVAAGPAPPVVPTPDPADPSPDTSGTLAATGAEVRAVLLLGAGAVLVGMSLLGAVRRRRS